MEALAVLGLVANIVKFVDLGGRIVRSAKEIQASADGTTRENKSLQEVIAEMRGLSIKLDPPKTESDSADESSASIG